MDFLPFTVKGHIREELSGRFLCDMQCNHSKHEIVFKCFVLSQIPRDKVTQNTWQYSWKRKKENAMQKKKK